MICLQVEFQLLVVMAVIYLTLGLPAIHHKNNVHKHKSNVMINHNDRAPEQYEKLYGRIKRQIDLDLSVDHEEDIGTDITAALNANIWRSEDGKSRLDGTARYNQHFDEFGQNGKSKVGGSIHFIHNY